MKFEKKHIGYFLLAMILGIIVYLLLRDRIRRESGFYRDNLLFFPNNNTPCMDCGPGGMFGPGWSPKMQQFHFNRLKQRAAELSNGLTGADLDRAIQNAGGVLAYIEGRETAIKRMEQATNDLRDVMSIQGVHGIGTMNDHIHIAVLDEATKQKALKFIEEKKKQKIMIPGHGQGYMGYAVMIAIEPQAKAQ